MRGWELDWPNRIDGVELAKRVMGFHHTPEDFNDGDIYQNITSFGEYQLKRFPLSGLNLNLYYVDDDRVAEYSTKVSDSAPPVIINPVDRVIIDGFHRANAAKKRGETDILAYVGVESTYEPVDDLYESLDLSDFARMDRAKALGFTTKAHHGTTNEFGEFELERGYPAASSGYAPHFTDKKKEATGYAKSRANARNEKGRVMDVLLRIRKPIIVPNHYGQWYISPEEQLSPEQLELIAGAPLDEKHRNIFIDAVYQASKQYNDKKEMWTNIYSRLRRAGYDAIIFKDVPADHIDGRYTKIVMLDMSGIRLTTAKFDPAHQDSTSITA